MSKRRGRGEGSLEQLPSGSWRAVVSRTVNGRRVKSSKTFPLKADAVRWRDKQREAGPAAAGTLGDWLSTWLELHRAKVAAGTYKTDRQTAERHLRPGLGSVRLRDLTHLKVDQFLARLKAAGVSQGERHKAGKVLRNALNAAVTAGQIPVSPMARLKVPARPEPDTHALDAPDLLTLVGAADRLGRGAMFRLWADAGLRPGELLGLSAEDWDAARGRVTVRKAVCMTTGRLKEPKTRRSRRTLPVAPSTAAAVTAYLGGREIGPLFPSPTGKHWWHSNFNDHVFGPVVGAAGVTATPYTLRHTMATLQLGRGVSMRAVSERLGHQDVATTLRAYAHSLPGDQERAAAVMEDLLGPKSHPCPTAAG